MKIVFFYHSLVSDWNHGNAHFLRGVASELLRRGHEVEIYEPSEAWSLRNLVGERGEAPVAHFRRAYPGLTSIRYDRLDVGQALAKADLVLVHEWNEPALVHAIGAEHPRSCVTLFHDTHHRTVTAAGAFSDGLLSGYDGVLAYGKALERLYQERALARRAWTWHEAADTTLFRPIPGQKYRGDLVWIGNWGDDERTEELEEFLLKPVERLGLKAWVFGVRYPPEALRRFARIGIRFGGWVANFKVPQVFSRFRVTVHIPRRPYVSQLPGIPTIRPFEALACGIPLVCSPWDDEEGLFSAGRDYMVARDAGEMEEHLERVLREPDRSKELAAHGLKTIQARHTCAHRVDELMEIYQEAKRSR